MEETVFESFCPWLVGHVAPAREYRVQEVLAAVGLVFDDVCSSAEVVRAGDVLLFLHVFFPSVCSFFLHRRGKPQEASLDGGKNTV